MELVSYYSNRPDLLSDLRRTCRAVFDPDDDLALPDPPACPGGHDWRIRDRLSDEDIQTLVTDFKAGTSKRKLALQYKISESSVKNLLRQQGVRRVTCLAGRLATTATSFTRAAERPVPLGFWEQDLAVMQAVEDVASALYRALVLVAPPR